MSEAGDTVGDAPPGGGAEGPDGAGLPHLPEIFRLLIRGYHISFADGALYRPLADRYAEYREYFCALGLHLTRHVQGFFYLESERTELRGNEKRSAAMLVFALVLIESLGDRGEPVTGWIFSGAKAVSDLPHLESRERYRNLLRDLGVETAEDLGRECLRPLERIGMLEFSRDDAHIRFKEPFRRFIDICLEIGGEAADGSEDSAEGFEETADGAEEPTTGDGYGSGAEVLDRGLGEAVSEKPGEGGSTGEEDE